MLESSFLVLHLPFSINKNCLLIQLWISKSTFFEVSLIKHVQVSILNFKVQS